MKIKTEYIMMFTICVLSFLLLKECNGDVETKEVTIIKTDTLHTKSIDTIMFTDTVNRYIELSVQAPSLHVQDSDTIYVYKTNIKDSLIEGLITTHVKGVMLRQGIDYKPKFPKYIYQRDTFRINTEKNTYISKNELFFGGFIGGSSNKLVLAPGVGLKTKTGLFFTGNYDLINKTYNLGIYKKFNLKFR